MRHAVKHAHTYTRMHAHTHAHAHAATAKFIKVHHPALSFVAPVLVLYIFLCSTLWPDFAELQTAAHNKKRKRESETEREREESQANAKAKVMCMQGRNNSQSAMQFGIYIQTHT